MDGKKWWQIAKFVLPLITGQLDPGSKGATLIPIITDAIDEAQQLHGDSHNDAKRQIVLDAVQIATTTGKVAIDPVDAMKVTNAVIDSVDAIHKVVKDNQDHVAVG